MLDQSEYKGGRKTRKVAAGELGVVKNARLDFNAALKDPSEGVGMRYPTDLESPDMKNDTKLPTKDEDDNPVIGHFCVFSCVAKFPYKYMKDPQRPSFPTLLRVKQVLCSRVGCVSVSSTSSSVCCS